LKIVIESHSPRLDLKVWELEFGWDGFILNCSRISVACGECGIKTVLGKIFLSIIY